MNYRLRILVLALALAQAGCPVAIGEPVPAEVEVVDVSAWPIGASCDQDSAQAVGDWLDQWLRWHQNGAQLEWPTTGYVVRDGARLPSNAIIIRLASDGLYVNHRIATRSLHDTHRARAALVQDLEDMQKRGPRPLALTIESDVTGAQLGQAMPIFEDLDLRLAFEAPPISAPYRVPSAVRGANPQFYRRHMLVRSSKPAPTCAALSQLGTALTKATPEARWKLLAEHLGPAWASCDCDTDIGEYLAGITSTYDRRPLATAGPILDRTAPLVRVRAERTWTEIAAGLTGGPVWFVASGAPPKVVAERPFVHGALKRDVVRATVESRSAELAQCYEESAWIGRVVVRYVVASDGTVIQSAIKETTIGNARVEQCILLRVDGWTFSPPDAGVAIVHHPFRLTF